MTWLVSIAIAAPVYAVISPYALYVIEVIVLAAERPPVTVVVVFAIETRFVPL